MVNQNWQTHDTRQDSFFLMELARKMNYLADTVACMQRHADQVTQTILSVNTAIYEIVQGGNGDYDKLRDTLNDLTLELGNITQCAEEAEDASTSLSEEVERAASKDSRRARRR